MASIRKRGNTFTITAYMGYDEQGRQRKKTTTFTPPPDVTPGKAEKLARAFATMWEDKIRGYVALDENRTFSELAEWYYSAVAPAVLKPNVMIDNQSIIYTYIMPTLARKKLKEIAPSMLDSLFAELKANGRTKDTYKLVEGFELPKGRYRGVNLCSLARDTGMSRTTLARLNGGHGIEKENAEKVAAALNVKFPEIFVSDVQDRSLEESTVSRIRRCLSAIFTAAVKKEIMRRNPVSNTVAIKKRSNKPVSYLDEAQALDLITALDGQEDFQFKVMINTLLFTGMRGGELCGLQWQDIDFDRGIIFIRHTLAYIRNTGQPKGQRKGSSGKVSVYELQSTKTAAGERYVVIPASLLDLLKEHRKRQDEHRASVGKAWTECGMVFTAPFGGYHAEAYLNAKFKKFARKIGLPESVHLHSLRHTTASLLINSDVSPKVIADQLGHASAAITQDIYSHIFQSSKARAAQALDLKLNPKNG